MQKLERRDTYTPTDTPQIRSNCDSVVKHHCGVGEVPQNLKTLSNNSDVDYSQHGGSSDLRVQNIVYVLNMREQPLMPTYQQKANKLLKQGKANVAKRKPFTIQLKHPTGEAKQPITLGVDSGYKQVGFSAITDKRELLSGELKLRTDIPKLLEQRRNYRRTRRSRLWHRKPRFDNRGKKDSWLAPSIQHKLDSHVRLVDAIKKILPIANIIVEVASFDAQKMQNPEISGVEYQQGTLQGYEVREYLLEKWNRRCAYCEKSGVPLQVEHIIPRSRGGSDRVSNLTISCQDCNQKKGNMIAREFGYPDIQEQAKKSLKATAFMNNVRWKLVDMLGCDWTYGSITKHNRTKLGLEKSHINDAFVIAGGTSAVQRSIHYTFKQVRRNNRSIQLNRKGFGRSIRKQRYSLQPNDLIRCHGEECRVKGIFNKGSWVRFVDDVGNIINSNIKDVELICYGKGIYG